MVLTMTVTNDDDDEEDQKVDEADDEDDCGGGAGRRTMDDVQHAISCIGRSTQTDLQATVLG